jgi:hypothetical protein
MVLIENEKLRGGAITNRYTDFSLLATIGGYTYRHTRLQYSEFQELGGIYRQQCDLISLLLFFQNKESRLKVGLNI